MTSSLIASAMSRDPLYHIECLTAPSYTKYLILSIGVDKGLLIDPPDALQRSDIEGVLRAAIARALAVELAMRLLVGLGLLERGNLRFGEQHAFLCHLDLERLQAVLHRGQIVTLPDPAHARGRNRHAP